MRNTLLVVIALVAIGALFVPIVPAEAQVHKHITTWGSLGGSGEAKFSSPSALAVDYLGNVYVADTGNGKIQKYNNVGGFIKEWRTVGDATLESPSGIAIDDNMVYVVDKSLDAVIVYDLEGNYSKHWGQNGIADGQLQFPFGIAVNGDTVYVADTGNARIQTFTTDGEHQLTFERVSQPATPLESPVGIVIADDGSIFVSDPPNAQIHKYDSQGNLVNVIDSLVGGLSLRSHGITIDSEGMIYSADAKGNRVARIDSTGSTISVWGTYGVGIYQFVMPTSVATDLYGQLFVMDSGAHAVKKFETPNTIYGNERSAARDAARAAFEAASTPETPAIEAPSPTQPAITPSITTSVTPSITPVPAQQPSQVPTPVAPTITAVPGDLKKPTIHAPHDITVEAAGILTLIDIGQATASDESGILSIQHNAPSAFTLGTNTVIWTAIDGAHNSAIDTQTVTILDTIPPTIQELDDVVLEAVSPDRNHISIVAPTATDTVGVLDITSDAPGYYAIGSTPVTWTAHDIAGNTASTVHNIIIADTTPPQIRAPQDVDQEATSAQANEIFLGDPITTDNGIIISVSNDAPLVFPLGQTTVTWTAADSRGNLGQDTQLVTITDTTSPDALRPADVIVEATSAAQNTVELQRPQVRDIQDLTFENDAPDVYPIGDTTVTWTITDVAGLITTVEQLVRVHDTTPPSLIVQDVTVEASSYDENEVSLGSVQVTDTSDIESITNDAPAKFTLGQTTVTWTVVDIYENTATATQSVLVEDTTPPSIFAPTSVTTEYAGSEGTVVDIGIPTVADLVGIADISNNAPPLFGIGQTQVEWTVTDQSGNTSSAIQTISITDTAVPTISAPQGITAEATSPQGTPVNLGTPVYDDLSGSVTVTNDAPTLFEIGPTSVTWTATDSSGNEATAPQIVIIQDTTAPRLVIPHDVTVEATSQHQNSVPIGTATAHDSASEATVSNSAPEFYSVGITNVTWTAVDSSSNTATGTQNISVLDTTPPTITAPQDIVAEVADALGAADLGTPESDDTVQVGSVTNDAPDQFSIGQSTITWTATDAAGNTATDTQLVTIQDTTPPTLVAPFGLTYEATSETQNIVNLGEAQYSDETEVVTIENNAPEFFAMGQTEVMWAATDAHGNTKTDIQLVTIADTTSPQIEAPSDITAEATSPDATIVDIGLATATDAVNIASVTNNAPSTYELGKTFVRWIATDTSDNTAGATQEITLVDTTPPTLVLPDDIEVEATSEGPVEIDVGEPTVTDLGSRSVTITNDVPPHFELGRTLVSWTASDESGNVASGVQSVTVIDTTAPSLTAPEDITAEADSASGKVLYVGMATAEDSAGPVEIESDAPEEFPIGVTTVTWTATDVSGLVSQVTQTVTVADTTAPRIVTTTDIVVEAHSIEGTPVQISNPYTTDEVGITSIRNDAPALYNLGNTVVTWTASDEAGNEGIAFQTIKVIDTIDPVIADITDIMVNATSPLTLVNVAPPEATDIIDSQITIASDIPESFPLGPTVINWTATDDFGNVAIATQTVTVLACGKDHTTYNAILGTEVDDTLEGTDAADLVFGLDGSDVINAGDGDDCIFGGSGEDIIIGGQGNDVIVGGPGNDVLRGQQGADVLDGSEGADIVNGGPGEDVCTDTDDQDALSECQI